MKSPNQKSELIRVALSLKKCGEHSVADKTVKRKNYMSRLLAADWGVCVQKFLQDVFVADGGSEQLDIFCLKRCFQTDIAHNGCDDCAII